jgi:hypothetical protein
MPIDMPGVRQKLNDFDFKALFIDELGWSRPVIKRPVHLECKEVDFELRHVAELAGVVVLEVTAPAGTIPDAKLRAALHKEICARHHENLLIFIDAKRTQSLWYWVKRQDGKNFPRDHLYIKGQPADLFISKLGSIVFDLSEFDEEGNVSVIEVANRLRQALDVDRVTKKFYREFQEQHIEFLDLIKGIPDERQRRWYASVLLNRLMFIYFLQRKYFLDDGNEWYLQQKLKESKERGRDRYYRDFLKLLFFEGFAKPEEQRSAKAQKLLGSIKYLNGGLFLPHKVEQDYPEIDVPDLAFQNLFALFERYSWNLDDTPGGKADEINPDVLGYIFEKYINQKAFGAYYTRPEITEYLCERTIHRLILDAVNTPGIPGVIPARQFDTIADLLVNLDAHLCRRLLMELLPRLSLLDPACGSGAFLVAAMKTLINVYAAVVGRIKFLTDRTLSKWLADAEKVHPSLNYFIKKSIITDNLFGVDIMEEATEIARLRLFLALVAAAETVDQLEPLPNIDFNILAGNSLIGLLRVDEADFNRRYQKASMYGKSYHELVEEKNRLIENYRHAASYAEDLRVVRDEIQAQRDKANAELSEVLCDDFKNLGIKFEQATWDMSKNKEGKPIKRPLAMKDIEALRPFHWGYEFDKVLNERGGFDAIITNPPWEIFKPNSKEFFEEHSELVSKKKMTIHEFEKERAKLLKDPEVRKVWLEYLSSFPHVSSYFRAAVQYKNQVSIVNGKKAGTDINLYKLFVEQCFNLLRVGGRCGIIVPGGIYNDLGAKQLRLMLFTDTQFDTIIGLSNERYIFEGVHHDQKFCLVVFCKGGVTDSFDARFRINVREAISPDDLGGFLSQSDDALRISVPLIRRLSPDSLSIMDFRTPIEIHVAEKMHKFPLIRDSIKGQWRLRFCNEFHMTGDSDLFEIKAGPNRLPLYEGKMIHQFTHLWGTPRYWLDETKARKRLLAARLKAIRQVAKKAAMDFTDGKQILLDYEVYRLAFRDVGTATNERSMIMTVLPPRVFCPHTVSLEEVYSAIIRDGKLDPNFQELSNAERLFICAVMNSFVVDSWLRRCVSKHVSFFYVYSLPVPRIKQEDPGFNSTVERAAKLVCTTPEFDDLAEEMGLKSHKSGITDSVKRAQIRAELDGLIAHLYGLTEEEFAYILTTFPLVADPVKVTAQNAYRDVARGLIR